MTRYFIWLAYDGRAYHGWQVQPNGLAVQQVVEHALSTLLRQPTDVVGAGRTDAGVSADGMVAHFDTPTPLSQPNQLLRRLDRMLPQDIAAWRIETVCPNAHARFTATWREYHYHITLRKEPLRRHFAWHVPFDPDFALMNEAARMLMDYQDFTSFSKLHTDTKTNICHLTQALWTELQPGCWQFNIRADRFLRGMVRAVVGTLLDVGRGRTSIPQMRAIVEKKNRCAAGQNVPAYALTLHAVGYPDGIFLPPP